VKKNKYFDFSRKPEDGEIMHFVIEMLFLLIIAWPLLARLFGKGH
jgi:hypothetical protein